MTLLRECRSANCTGNQMHCQLEEGGLLRAVSVALRAERICCASFSHVCPAASTSTCFVAGSAHRYQHMKPQTPRGMHMREMVMTMLDVPPSCINATIMHRRSLTARLLGQSSQQAILC